MVSTSHHRAKRGKMPLLLLLLALLGGGFYYVAMLDFPASTQPINKELSYEALLSATQ